MDREELITEAMKPKGKAKHPHDANRPESAAVRRALELDDMDALALALSPRQMAFCREYIVDFVGNKAAIRAGYARKHVDQQASLLLRHKGVKRMIQHLSESKEAKITAVDPDYVIQKVTEIITKEGAKDGDKLRGLELLARHLGMLRDRTEISGPDGGAIQHEEIENESNEFRRRIASIAKRGGGTVVPLRKSSED